MTEISRKSADLSRRANAFVAAALLAATLAVLVLLSPHLPSPSSADCIVTDNAGCVADPTPGDGPSGVLPTDDRG